ncbi:MAG: ADP-ribosylglycohydrolase family protein, partial [Opitutaceae bacterium]
ALHAVGVPHEEVIDGIHREWNELTTHGWCHTISNAQIVTASLLYGGDDYTTTIALAVAAGFDTDCNGATCGSLWGVRHGERALPKHWLRPLKNKLRTGVSEYAVGTLDEMAEQMVTVAESVRR